MIGCAAFFYIDNRTLSAALQGVQSDRRTRTSYLIQSHVASSNGVIGERRSYTDLGPTGVDYSSLRGLFLSQSVESRFDKPPVSARKRAPTGPARLNTITLPRSLLSDPTRERLLDPRSVTISRRLGLPEMQSIPDNTAIPNLHLRLRNLTGVKMRPLKRYLDRDHHFVVHH